MFPGIWYGRNKVGFVVYDQIGKLFFTEKSDQFLIGSGWSSSGIYHKYGNVSFVQDSFGAFYAKFAKLSYIINAWSVNDDYGTKGKKLHGFGDRVGGGSFYV